MVLLAYYWSSLFHIAIPNDELAGINWKWLYLLSPFFCALGEFENLCSPIKVNALPNITKLPHFWNILILLKSWFRENKKLSAIFLFYLLKLIFFSFSILI